MIKIKFVVATAILEQGLDKNRSFICIELLYAICWTDLSQVEE